MCSQSVTSEDSDISVIPTRLSWFGMNKTAYHAANVSDEELGGSVHSHSPLSPSTPCARLVSRRRSAVFTISLVAAAIVIFVTGYTAGERHEKKLLGLGLPLVANGDLLDEDDDTVEVTDAETIETFEGDDDISGGTSRDINPSTMAAESSYQKFLVFAEQRSGSRFLTDLLDDHPHVRCGNEELNQKGASMNFKHSSLDEYMNMLDDTFERIYETPTQHSPVGQSKVIGFKVMYNQGVTHYGKDLMAKLDEAGIKVIHLIRRNKLLQYISFASNEKDKHIKAGNPDSKHNAHPKTKEEAELIRDEMTISGKPGKVLPFMEEKTEADTKVSNLISSYLDSENYAFVDYEDLSDKTDEEMARLFDLLGVEAQTVETQMEKIHEGKQTRSYFKPNQQEALKEALEQSQYSWVLDGW